MRPTHNAYQALEGQARSSGSTLPTLPPYCQITVGGFTPRSRIVHLYGGVTITGKGVQNLAIGLCSGPLSREGFFIVPHLL
jgi:hypothetical protein